MNTNDLSKFGRTELEIASILLKKLSENDITDRVRDYITSGLRIELNPQSGNVFLVDDDCNVFMLNNQSRLDLVLYTPDSGYEGFFDELLSEYKDMTDEDKEYMKSYDTEHIIEDLEGDEHDEDRK